jgi:hypothetical protein
MTSESSKFPKHLTKRDNLSGIVAKSRKQKSRNEKSRKIQQRPENSENQVLFPSRERLNLLIVLSTRNMIGRKS